MEAFDRAALEADTGIRAIWLLYKRGKWGFLEDFGVERAVAERFFIQFERDYTVAGRLTKGQCRLVEQFPGVAEAGRELRLAYALKYYTDTKLSRAERASLADSYHDILWKEQA